MDLSVALLAGSHLIESPGTPHSSLKSTLLNRLKRYHECIQSEPLVNESSSLEQVQLQTAEEALITVERINSILEASDSSIPLIGTRDITLLRTLLSIAIKWAIEPCLLRIIVSCADKKTVNDEDYISLFNHLHRFFHLVFPSGGQGPIAQSHIAISIIDKYALDALKSSITLGWIPKSLVSSASGHSDEFSILTARFLALLTPSQGITALSTVMSSKPSAPHIRRACATLLSSQLMRPNGIHGLCVAIFGEHNSSEDSADLTRLENVARVLVNVPSGMPAESYFLDTIPRMITVLCDSKSLPAYKRAMGFALSRMLAADILHHASASKILLSQLHNPLTGPSETDVNTPLSILTDLIMNADPSPTLISALLSPVIPSVYALSFYLDSIKTSDPTLKESVRSILATWARVVAVSEGVDCLWQIITGEKSNWQTGSSGLVKRVESVQEEVPLAMFTPESLERAEEAGELDSDSNLLGFYPDPVQFVQFLQSLGQSELSSGLFVKLLEAYRDQKERDSDDDPSRTLHFLQLILQMQTRLSALNILNKPDHILVFIQHALEASTKTPPSNGPEDSDADSDDDTPNSVLYTADDEVIETSVNLLLSVLEANQDLSARTAPILNTIFSLLEPLASGSNPEVRSIAREARMVMTARLASTSASSTPTNVNQDDAQQTYQKALKLLQDPILPVRAHGLLLLRQLVAPSMKDRLDSALVPAIISIFLQSVQDEDSYMYLNAIQGLAALADTYGKEILKSLVHDYAHGLERGHSTEQEVNTRLRIGEALGMIMRRCGNTLAAYASTLVPPLLHIVQSGHVATTLRTSAVSLLAECESVYAPALLPFLADLWEGMVDLLQVESHRQQVNGLSEDSDPTIVNAKLPLLRRAAIHLLSQLIRETTRETYESPQWEVTLMPSSIERAKITLAYVAGTDGDTLVRVMARETAGLIHDLERATAGL